MPGMQFPYPRKSSGPTPYKPATSTPLANRRDVRRFAVYALGGFSVFFFLLWLFGGSSSTVRIPPATPEVVIVTTLDKSMSDWHRQMIMENRKDYAQRHGYTTFFPNNTDYDLMPGVPKSWSMLPGMRHAMATWPHTPWLWYLSSTALIMDPSESLHAKVLEPRKLESLMIVDKPVVPPDSVIKTFAHLRGERVDLVLTQDKEGLASGSVMVRTGEWAKYFLDAWFDPLYRSYNFQKAESHALEHIVQWHGTILAKLALIPQRHINSYVAESANNGDFEGVYRQGDFIANFYTCQRDPSRNCEEDMAPMISRWRELRDQERKR